MSMLNQDTARDIICRLQKKLGECSGALELVGHPIEWQARIDAAVAAERERWTDVVAHAVSELEALDDETAQCQAESLRWLLPPNK